MFSFDADPNSMAGLAGVNSDPSNGDILPQAGANQPPMPGSPDGIALPTLVPEGYDNIVLSPGQPVDYGGTPAETALGAVADPLTGSGGANNQLAVLSDALALGYEQLKQFAGSPDLLTQMDVAFGNDFNAEVAGYLAGNWSNGLVNAPPIEVVSAAEIDGADAAFAGATKTIYISEELLARGSENAEVVANAWLEEYGHYVDTLINVADTPGDEGAIFAAVVGGEELSSSEIRVLKAENDQITLSIDGQSTLLERSSSDWTVWVYDRDGNRLGETSLAKRGDGLNGLKADWGEGSVLEGRNDNFQVFAWHQAYFDSSQTYKVRVTADDYYQIYVSRDGENWGKTSLKNDAYRNDSNYQDSFQEYNFTPSRSGDYYIAVRLVEEGGNAYVDFSWDDGWDKNQGGLDYSDGDKAIQYIYEEMVNNAQSWQTQRMRDWNGTTGILAKASALSLWGGLVFEGSAWDHKPKLTDRLNLDADNDFAFPIRGDSNHEYYYDIWSNIHYGYAGTAAGFNWQTLQAGAGLDDVVKGNLDGDDMSAISLGVDLWNEYGTNLTPERLREKIISNGSSLSRFGIRNGE